MIDVNTDSDNNVVIDVETTQANANVSVITNGNRNSSIGTTALYGPKGEKGDTGDKGDKGDTGDTGEQGVQGNGIASIEKTSTSGLVDTYTITFDDDDTTTFTVTNGQNGTDGVDGQDGTDGQDGYSPTATVTQTSSGATVSITDKNGTTTANITNGTDGTNGQDGADGADGYSPTATVTQSGSVTTISITDENGTTTESIDLTDYENLIPVTYSELVTLKNGGNLVEGAYYRITDYVTTTNGNTLQTGHPTRSAGHAFDIIIQAVGTSNLAEIGTAALHSGDTYFANQNLGAWQIWYDINNNTSKYLWADTTNGKGVIYRMIDEKGNDLPYDFKNIQFYRDKTDTKYSDIASTYLLSPDDYYYTFSKAVNNVIQDYSVVGGTSCINNVFTGGRTQIDGSYRLLETIFIAIPQSGEPQTFCSNTFEDNCFMNTHCGQVQNNTVGSFFHDNVTNGMWANQISYAVYNNIFASDFSGNIVIRDFYNNTFKGGVHYNYFGARFHDNTFSSVNPVDQNITCGSFYSNTVSSAFWGNLVQVEFYNNTIDGAVSRCTFATSFIGNTTKNLTRSTFGSTCQNNNFQKEVLYCDFGANLANNTFKGTLSFCTSGAYVQYIQANGNLSGVTFGDVNGAYIMGTHTSLSIDPYVIGTGPNNRLDLTDIPSGKAARLVKGNNGEVIAKWKDGANDMGLIKASVTTSTWSDLLPTFTWET